MNTCMHLILVETNFYQFSESLRDAPKTYMSHPVRAEHKNIFDKLLNRLVSAKKISIDDVDKIEKIITSEENAEKSYNEIKNIFLNSGDKIKPHIKNLMGMVSRIYEDVDFKKSGKNIFHKNK